MTTKLRIDISQGLIDIEGDPDLVREIYTDFKTHLFSEVKFAQSEPPSLPGAAIGADTDEPIHPSPKSKAKRRPAAKKKTKGDETGSDVVADLPKLDKNLDTSELDAFYGQFAPRNNAEKILIFLKFMTETLDLENPNTDQVYTCFKATGEKIPKAFAQAFYDTSRNYGYIDFRSSTDLPIMIAGENHFNHKISRKTAE